MTNLDQLVDQAGEMAKERPAAPETVQSPARSGAGNLRAFKQMGDTKLRALYEEMREGNFYETDSEAMDAVRAEVLRRGGLHGVLDSAD